ncbi:MAG TPA: dTMP kinase [Rectinemataceae bacterium]
MAIGDTDTAAKKFIVFEGIDGSGTTSQLERLSSLMRRAGMQAKSTAEPTDRPEGILIRRILKGEIEADPGTVAYLFAADRWEHVYGRGGVLEVAGSGTWVLCDRYILSSLAYQGTTCGPELPALLNSPFPPPGLTIYFRIDPDQSMERVARRKCLDIYEKLHMQKLFSRAYDTVVERKLAEGWRIETIDAGLGIDEVTQIAARIVGDYCGIPLLQAGGDD